MYLLKECQRLLQRPARDLLEAPEIREETFRPVDMILLEETRQRETEANEDDDAPDDLSEKDQQDVNDDDDGDQEASETASEEEASTLGEAQVEGSPSSGAAQPAEEIGVTDVSSGAAQPAEEIGVTDVSSTAVRPVGARVQESEDARPARSAEQPAGSAQHGTTSAAAQSSAEPVSYTHLTLPTKA